METQSIADVIATMEFQPLQAAQQEGTPSLLTSRSPLFSDLICFAKQWFTNYGHGVEFQLRPVYKKIFDYYFSEMSKLDKNKGLLFIGDSFSGKTTLMRVFNAFLEIVGTGWASDDKTHEKYHIIEPRALKQRFTIKHIKAIEKQYLDKDIQMKCFDNLFQRGYPEYSACKLLLDDVGMESRVSKQYGNELNIFEQIISIAYDEFPFLGYQLHVTSNLPMWLKVGIEKESFKSRYDTRIYNRLSAMFNIVLITK